MMILSHLHNRRVTNKSDTEDTNVGEIHAAGK